MLKIYLLKQTSLKVSNTTAVLKAAQRNYDDFTYKILSSARRKSCRI